MERIESNNFFINIIKGVAISLLLTIICLSIFSALLTYTNLSENLMQPVVIVVTGISILIGSYIANRKRNKNGIINGIIIGVIYILALYIISSAVNDGNFSLNLGAIIMILVGIIGGAIGGILGVNI